MELQRIELRNYAQHHDLTVEFKGSLISVIGRNGSGKSNFIGAAQFALTGEQPPFNKTDLLSWRQDAGWVKLWFTHNGKKCLVERRIESAGCSLTIGDEKFNGAKKVAEAMASVLGLDADILKQYVFVRQTKVDACLYSTPAENERNLMRVLGLGDATKINAQLGDVISGYGQPESFEEAIAEHVAKAGEIRGQLSEIEAVAKEISDRLAGMDEKSVSDEIRELESNLKLVERAVSERSNAMHWRGVLAQFHREHPDVGGRLPENPEGPILEKVHEMESRISRVKAAIDRNEDRDGLSGAIRALEKSLSGMRPEEDIRKDLSTLEGLNEENARLKAEESQLSELLSKAPDGDTCPLCGSRLGEGHNIRAELSERLAAVKLNRKVVADSARGLSGLGKELDDRRHAEDRLSYLSGQLERMGGHEPEGDANVAALEAERDAAKASLSDARMEYRKAIDLDNELTRLEGNLGDAEASLKSAMDALPGSDGISPLDLHELMGDMKSDLESAKSRMAQIAEVKADKAGVEGELSQIRKQLSDFEEMIGKLRAKQEENDRLRAKLSVLNDVRDWFSYKNGPRVLTRGIMSVLTDSVNSYLDKFGAAFTVEPSTEGVGFLVRFNDGRDMPDQLPDASRLSGGQKVTLAVAFRFAIYAIFSGKLGLLILDEPTAYLDAETIGRFGDLLQRIAQIARNSGLQVIMATHEASLAPVFDQTIQIGD